MGLDSRCPCICHGYPYVGSGMSGIPCTTSPEFQHLYSNNRIVTGIRNWYDMIW